MNDELYKRCFKNSLPAYILDLNYNILDFNIAFKEFSKDFFRVEVGRSILDFIHETDNSEEMLKRSATEFSIGSLPLVDLEDLHLTHQTYGKCHWLKIASQIHEGGKHLGWFVEYNIVTMEKIEQFWKDCLVWLEKGKNDE